MFLVCWPCLTHSRLLLGIDEENKEMVCGLVDTIGMSGSPL